MRQNAGRQKRGTRPLRQRVGTRAEDVVARYLEDLGWEICGRNVRVGRYELDVVAVDARTAVVVEVRLRGSSAWTTAIGSIDGAKRRRLRLAAARLWRDQFKNRPGIDHLRFDVAAVHLDERGRAVIEHVRAAFS